METKIDTVTCPVCRKVHEIKHPLLNVICDCGAKYYGNCEIWLDRKTGHLFLNEVYDWLRIPRRAIGQCVGWIYDENNPNGDNFVDLGIFNERNNNDENVFILDPNVDGYILDKI